MSVNKWIPLDGKKEPPSSTKLALWLVHPKGKSDEKPIEYWDYGYLTGIEFEGDVKQYVFKSGDNEIREATHFMEISKPK